MDLLHIRYCNMPTLQVSWLSAAFSSESNWRSLIGEYLTTIYLSVINTKPLNPILLYSVVYDCSLSSS